MDTYTLYVFTSTYARVKMFHSQRRRAVKIRSQGPLRRLMIDGCVFPTCVFPTCPNTIKCAQAALAFHFSENIIKKVFFCRNVLNSPAKIFIRNSLFDFPPQKAWLSSCPLGEANNIASSKFPPRTIYCQIKNTSD